MSSDTLVDNSYNRSYLTLVLQREGNFTNTNASYNKTDVVVFAPAMYYLIGSLMTVIMVTGFSTNLAILYTYATNRKIRTVDNTLIIGLALSDIGQAVFGIPFVAISSFSKQWIFGHAFCQYYAFITTSFGIAQISMLTVIAMERYLVIVKHDRRLTNTTFRCVIVIMCSFIYGSTWATGPLLGWSGYKEEEIGIACCVKWEIKDSVAFSYTISLCTFGWLIPCFLIAFGYISIACSIHNERKKRSLLRRQAMPNKTNRERKVAITVLIMIGAFFVSWTPYSAVSLWSAVGDFNSIPLWVQVAPAVFAKCSIIWNPLIYVARHEKFRQGVKQSLSYLKFWGRDLNDTHIGGINTFQPAAGGRQRYREIEANTTKDLIKRSITSDNYATYIESPARSKSSSSVFLRSPASFRHQRLKRHLTFFSTLDSSQQIMEKSETDALDFVKALIPCESKCTQTDYVFVHLPSFCAKEVSNKCVQTDFSSLILIENRRQSSPGMIYKHDVLERSEREKDTLEIGNQVVFNLKSNKENRNNPLAVKAKSFDDSRSNQLKHSKEYTSNPQVVELQSDEDNGNYYLSTVNHNSDEVNRTTLLADRLTSYVENSNDRLKLSASQKSGNASLSRNLKIQKTNSLEVLKKKRKVLKQQLKTIYQDKQSAEISPVCSERQDLNRFVAMSKLPLMHQASVYESSQKDKPIDTITGIGARQYDTEIMPKYEVDLKIQKGAMPKRPFTYSRSLKPYHVHKQERYKEKLKRERIVSEPDRVEMQTYIYKPVARRVNTYQGQKLDDNSVMNMYPENIKSTIIRQSTV